MMTSCDVTEELKNDDLCNPKINANLSNTINEVWGRKMTPVKLKIRS